MKNLSIGLAVIALVVAVYAVLSPSTPEPVVVDHPAGSVVSSQGISNPICVDGSCTWDYQIPMRVATGTVCSIKAPNATTTLRFVGFNIFNATSTAGIFRIATGTTAYATTSLIANGTNNAVLLVNANNTASFAMVPTGPTTASSSIMAPNQYVNFDIQASGASGAGGFTVGGSCDAVFLSI